LRQWKPKETVVVFAQAAGTPQAKLDVTTLADADASAADMRTLVLIGSSTTRVIERLNAWPWVYTPRSEGAPE
jgi:precorrin-3B C17-methyltransferase